MYIYKMLFGSAENLEICWWGRLKECLTFWREKRKKEKNLNTVCLTNNTARSVDAHGFCFGPVVYVSVVIHQTLAEWQHFKTNLFQRETAKFYRKSLNKKWPF